MKIIRNFKNIYRTMSTSSYICISWQHCHQYKILQRDTGLFIVYESTFLKNQEWLPVRVLLDLDSDFIWMKGNKQIFVCSFDRLIVVTNSQFFLFNKYTFLRFTFSLWYNHGDSIESTVMKKLVNFGTFFFHIYIFFEIWPLSIN